MRGLSLFIILLLSCTGHIKPTPDPKLTRPSKKAFEKFVDYDSVNKILLYQDRLWAGTSSGLTLFDFKKNQIQKIQSIEGLPSGGIISICKTSQGRIYFATASEITYFEKGIFVNINKSPPVGNINVIAADPYNILWVGGTTGLAYYREQQWVLFQKGYEVVDIQASNQEIWVATKKQGMVRLRGGLVDEFGKRQGLPGMEILSFVWLFDGSLIVLVKAHPQNRLAFFNGVNFIPLEGRNTLISGQRLLMLNNRVLMLTETGLVALIGRYSKDEVAYYSPQFFPLPIYQNMQVAPPQSVEHENLPAWIQKKVGRPKFFKRTPIFGIHKSPIQVEDLAHVISIQSDDSGILWVGYKHQGIRSFDGENWKRFQTRDLVGEHFQKRPIVDQLGNYWVASHENFLLRYTGERWEKVFISPFPTVKAVSVAVDGAGNIYALHRVGDYPFYTLVQFDKTTQKWRVMGRGALFEKYRKNQITLAKILEPKTLLLAVRVFNQESKQYIPYGLVKTDFNFKVQAEIRNFKLDIISETPEPKKEDNKGFSFSLDESAGQKKKEAAQVTWKRISIPGNVINDLLITEDQTLWVATDNGLIRLKNSTVEVFNENNSLESEIVNAVIQDAQKNIWVGTSEGIFKFDGRKWLTYRNNPDWPKGNIRGLVIDKKGAVWASSGFKLFRFKDKWTEITAFDFSEFTQISNILVDERNRKWFFTPFGIILYTEE